jgi:tryptophan 2,3-dioxygenase
MSHEFPPILPGPGASDYERYLRTDELLALQKAPGEMAHRDELLFQTVHQTTELWLKLACFEVEGAIDLLRGRRILHAVRLLRRANDAMKLVTDFVHVLEHMGPWEFHEVRRQLGHGAGFDSPGFRRVHHLSPELGDALLEILKERGVDVVDVYRRGSELEELYQLAEQLSEWDERVLLWKYHHLQLVHRTIGGHVIGTQGTPVEVLERRLQIRFFPFLWDARDRLTEIAGTSPSLPGHGQ